MMSEWPPKFDGIKIENQKVLGRVKNTAIWLELDLDDPFWIHYFQSNQELAPLLAWLDL